MKKLIFSLVTGLALVLAGCLETTNELSLKEDGTGTYSMTNDMSKVVGVAKQMGGKDAEKMDEVKMDSTISLAQLADSVNTLTPEEKTLMKEGTAHVNIDPKAEKFVVTLKFDFKKISDVPKYSTLSTKLMSEIMGKLLGGDDMPMGSDMPEPSSFDNYYDIVYTEGLISKKLNKEKYAGAESDEYLKGMKEAGSMGIPVTNTQVIILPRPAKKVEGKKAKLSDDKKKITVESDIEDFFDDPDKMEFRIEY